MRNVSLLLLILFTSSIVLAGRTVEDYECHHTPEEKLAFVHLKARHAKKRLVDETFNQAYRVSVHYDSTFTTGFSTELRTRIQAVVNNVTNFLQSSLAVRRTPSPIILDRDCVNGQFLIASTEIRPCFLQCASSTTCGPATIPSEHLLRCLECNGAFNLNQCTESGSDGAGVTADFILYVSAVNTASCSGSTIAFAGACQMEDEYDRPISGFMNFCPNGIDSNSNDNFIFAVAKHEILHAMAFSTSLFPYFRDENGNPRTARDSTGRPIINGQISSVNTTQTVTYTNWTTRNGDVSKTVTLLITPKVVEVAKEHFNCSTLSGVQLEDQGGSGTALSHWEKRLLENEAMTGIISSNNAIFSNFTFALLEDSGWYKVNYAAAKMLVWGRGTGCGYTAGSCGGYIQSKLQQGESIAPFCNYFNAPISRYGCNVDHTAVSYCNLVQFTSSLPGVYQYFNSGENFGSSLILSRVGGNLQIADFCPFQRGFSNGVCTISSNLPGTGVSNTRGETYGPGSRCVEHSGRWTARGGGFISRSPFTQSGCYEYSCSNSVVTIKVLDRSYICSQAGQVITVSQTTDGTEYTGTLVCPSCVEICYDDFVNCPEAAQLYGIPSSSNVAIETSTSTTPSSSTMTTSSPVTTTLSTQVATTTRMPSTTSSSTQVTMTTSTPTTTSSSTQVATTTSIPSTTSSSTQVAMTTSTHATTSLSTQVATTTRIPPTTSSSTQVTMTTSTPTTTSSSTKVAMTTSFVATTSSSALVAMMTRTSFTISLSTQVATTTITPPTTSSNTQVAMMTSTSLTTNSSTQVAMMMSTLTTTSSSTQVIMTTSISISTSSSSQQVTIATSTVPLATPIDRTSGSRQMAVTSFVIMICSCLIVVFTQCFILYG